MSGKRTEPSLYPLSAIPRRESDVERVLATIVISSCKCAHGRMCVCVCVCVRVCAYLFIRRAGSALLRLDSE